MKTMNLHPQQLQQPRYGASGYYNFIGGGFGNASCGSGSSVVGGTTNFAIGDCSIVGGGISNCSTAAFTSVLGGKTNTASAYASAVVGGCANTASGCMRNEEEI